MKGNLTSIDPPSPLPDTTITYDGLSRVKTVKDGKDQTKTYTYDVFDRVTSITFQDGSATTYTYDDDGNQRKRIDTAGASTKTTDYDYD